MSAKRWDARTAKTVILGIRASDAVTICHRTGVSQTAGAGRTMTMGRLIDADAIVEYVRKYSPISDGADLLETWLEDAPTVDAVPVRHGRWIKKRYWSEGVGMGERYGYYYSCSKCGNLVCGGYDECGKKYCDECGARMDGKDGDT